MDLPRPATTGELYLQAILEELRALRRTTEQALEAWRRPAVVLSVPPADHPEPGTPPRKKRGRRPRKEIGGTIDPGLDPNVG